MMAAVMLLSCTTTKENNLSYFKDLALAESGTLPNDQSTYPIRIQSDDELVISITSAIPEATASYNLPMDNPATRGNLRQVTQPRSQTYIVDEEGYIMMPILGRIMARDKTISQLSNEIKALVERDVKDPHVRIDLVNFTVDVMGEVRSPQRVYSGRQNLTVLDALTQCGDLTEYGQRDRVYVIRTEEGKRTYHRLNLNSSEVFSSPYFYLKQNDVVYVEPNSIRIDNSKYNQNNSFKLSVISTIVSSASVVVSLIIALVR
jgi:polysaccharide export outer membrane protein